MGGTMGVSGHACYKQEKHSFDKRSQGRWEGLPLRVSFDPLAGERNPS